MPGTGRSCQGLRCKSSLAGTCLQLYGEIQACHVMTDCSNVIDHGACIHGLEDEEIHLDVLGDSKQDMTLEEAPKYVKAKEIRKRSASRLMGHGTISITAAPSSYRQNRRSTTWSINPVKLVMYLHLSHSVIAENTATDVMYRNV